MSRPERDDALAYEIAQGAARLWWLPLVTGIIWIMFSLVVLRFDIRSASAIGILMGVVFIAAGIQELISVALVNGGWKWLHGILGVLFVAGGITALVYPDKTFVVLASLVGWILLIKGVFDIILALTNRDVDLWWMRLVLGIVELALAVSVSGDFTQKAVFLIFFVGIFSMMRGITEIILAFQVRSAGKDLDRLKPA